MFQNKADGDIWISARSYQTGGVQAAPSGDLTMIESFISEIPDRATSQKIWQDAYVKGTAPEDIKASQLVQREAQEVSIEGTTASVMVEIKSSKTPEEANPIEWKLEKSGSDGNWHPRQFLGYLINRVYSHHQ